MTEDNSPQMRVETDRFGPFTFQIGVDMATLESLLLRVDDAHKRFKSSPLSQVAHRLEKEVVVSSIFGTNSIEGGTLSVEETEEALDLTPTQVQDIEQRRAINLKNAYELAQQTAAKPGWQLNVEFIRQIHAAVTDQLPHEYNHPGLLRDNPKGVVTRVGNQEHGGTYKPPQYGNDVERLLNALNRHFYVYQPPRPLEEIEADIKHLEQDIVAMLGTVLE